jgi:hypothetical protein
MGSHPLINTEDRSAQSGRPRNRHRRRLFPRPFGGIAPSVLVVAILITPLAAGTTPALITAPFHWNQRWSSLTLITSGCWPSSGMPHRWNATTGLLRVSMTAKASTCGNSTTGAVNGSQTYHRLLAGGLYPFSSTNFSKSLLVTWNLSGIYNTSIHRGGPCPKVVVNGTTGNGSQLCVLYFYDQILIEVSLIQNWNGRHVGYSDAQLSVLWATAYSDVNETCVRGACSTSSQSWSYGTPGSGSLPSRQNLTISGVRLLPNRQYDLNMTVIVNANVIAEGFPHSSARSEVDLWSGSYGASLASILVS